MASSRSSVIQFSDGQDAQSELQFQDFSHGDANTGVATLSPSASFTTFPDSPDLNNAETEDLLGEEKKETASFWEFSYYQSFFDVDTDQVLQRVLWSMIPLPGRATFLDRHIRPKPDLYGPFWITATLIFSTAICANIASYLVSEGQSAKAWSYDFHKVSLAATALYTYSFLWPIFLWGLMWYRKTSNRFSLLEVICVYGYSLAIYVPISILWVIQVSWFQWILVIVGAASSGTVLIQTFWSVFRDENKKIAALVLCLILLFHTLLAVGFVMYFFRPSNESNPSTMAPLVDIATTTATLKHMTTAVKESEDAVTTKGKVKLDTRNLVNLTEQKKDAIEKSNTVDKNGANANEPKKIIDRKRTIENETENKLDVKHIQASISESHIPSIVNT